MCRTSRRMSSRTRKCAASYSTTRLVTMSPAEDIFITDTTFRDGQQARPPYTVEQIVDIFDLMAGWAAPTASSARPSSSSTPATTARRSSACRSLGYRYPEITGWIRAVKGDFRLVKEMGLKETGILTSCRTTTSS